MTLFDLLRQRQEEPRRTELEGSLNVQQQLKAALSYALKPHSRWEVAGRMSHLLGHEITKSMLDCYTAESKELHRMPAEYLAAFCVATNSMEPLRVIAEPAGMFCLKGAEALRADIQKRHEEIKRLQGQNRQEHLLIKMMEGGHAR